MEFSEPGERARRPELAGVEPSRLFLVAKEYEQWIHTNLSEGHIPETVDYLVEDLERYVTETFEGSLPELVIQSEDVVQTAELSEITPSIVNIVTESRPFVGDDRLLGATTIQGRLFGFHRGTSNDLRVYVDTGTPPRHLPGGVYQEYLSVGVRSSEILFADDILIEEEYRQNRHLDELLSECDGAVNQLYTQLLREIHSTGADYHSRTVQLQKCSHLLARIEAHPEVKAQLIDALLDYITFTLQLDAPHSMEVDDHRISVYPNGFDIGGHAIFEDVEPRLCMMGETRARFMGLFFTVDPEHGGVKPELQMVQVPVPSIKSIIKKNW